MLKYSPLKKGKKLKCHFNGKMRPVRDVISYAPESFAHAPMQLRIQTGGRFFQEKTVRVAAEATSRIMTSTQKGITLRGSAELVADFFCKLPCFLPFADFSLSFSAPEGLRGRRARARQPLPLD